MRIRGGKMVQLHKFILLSLSTAMLWSFLFVSETSASEVKRGRRRSTTTTPHPTTLATTPTTPILPPQPSQPTSSAYSLDSSKSLRVSKVSRFTQRRGRLQQQEEYASDDGAQIKQIYATEGPHLVLEREEGLHFALERQPLYEEQADYNRMETQRYNQQSFDDKSHYYSPSQVQRQRKRLRQQKQRQGQGQGSGFNLEAPTAPLGYSQNPFPPSPQQPSYPNRFDDHSKPHPEEFLQPQPAPKNYAFAYAVRGDNNNANEDFSHKEARDGKLTMGEYRINLPDGRKQVVRYTAGGKTGYKADVTYEGDDTQNKDLAKGTLIQNNVSPAPGPPYFTGTPTGKKFIQRPRNSFTSNDDNEYTPAVEQYRPPKQSRRPRPRPTLTPKSSYSSGGDSEYHQQNPIPPVTFKSGPIRPSSDQEPPYYSSFGGGGSLNGGGGDSKRPKSIYDKMPNNGKSKQAYGKNKEGKTDSLSVLHEQSPRAGPLRSSFYNNNANIEASQSKEEVSSYPHKSSSPYNKPFYSSGSSSSSGTGPRSSSEYGNSYSSISHRGATPGNKKPKNFFKTVSPTAAFIEHEPIGPGPNSAYINFQPSYTGGSGFQSSSNGNGGGPGLIEDFKAGPTRKNPKSKQYKKPTNKYSSSPDYETKGYQGPSGPSNFHGNGNGNSGGSGFQDYLNSEPQHQFSSPKSFYNSNNDYNRNNNLRQPPSYSNSPSNLQTHPLPQSYPSFNPVPTGPTPTPAGPVPQQRYKEPFHYYNSQHEPYHHGGFTEPKPLEDHPSSANPTVSAYSVDYPEGGKKSVYFSSKSSSLPKPSKFNGYESAGRKKPTSSGLIYLETPGEGPRPSELGVQETLSRQPNMPGSRHIPGSRHAPDSRHVPDSRHIPDSRPPPGSRHPPGSHHRQSIHPYEVGSADYGKNVGYKNSPVDHLQDHHDETEGGTYNGHPPQEHDHHNDHGIHGRTHYGDSGNDHPYDDGHPNSYPRDYLSQGEPDRIVAYNAPDVAAPSLVLPEAAYAYAPSEEDGGVNEASVITASDADVTTANYFESQKTA